MFLSHLVGCHGFPLYMPFAIVLSITQPANVTAAVLLYDAALYNNNKGKPKVPMCSWDEHDNLLAKKCSDKNITTKKIDKVERKPFHPQYVHIFPTGYNNILQQVTDWFIYYSPKQTSFLMLLSKHFRCLFWICCL